MIEVFVMVEFFIASFILSYIIQASNKNKLVWSLFGIGIIFLFFYLASVNFIQEQALIVDPVSFVLIFIGVLMVMLGSFDLFFHTNLWKEKQTDFKSRGIYSEIQALEDEKKRKEVWEK
jgi:hypothetical protein